MSYPDPDVPLYYPEEYEYELHFENELKNHQSPVYQTTSLDWKNHKPTMLPTINYMNERKCPIYVHNIRKDSSIYNHYSEKLAAAKKPSETEKPTANKQVLDKLEETYWSTWRPKKENRPVGRKGFLGLSNSKPGFLEHKVRPKVPNKPHGDINDNIIKYFKAKEFESGSTTDSVNQAKEPVLQPPTSNSVSQEIQTEVHCPVILEESPRNAEKVASAELAPVEEPKPSKPPKGKNQKKVKPRPEKSANDPKAMADSDNSTSFIEHKDSVEITKTKQEKTECKERVQQPKCIRLFRKSGLSSGYIKGGTYPLKSCLKKEGSPLGHFRLGPPGSPLFVTSGSFSNRKKK